MSFGGASNYPPGVTGREPQISGIYPREQVIDGALDELKRARVEIENCAAGLDDQGALSDTLDQDFDALTEKLDEIERTLKGMLEGPEDPRI